MANKGLHAFTVQEATNYSAFSSWNYEEIDQSDSPAKKVVIYNDPDVAGVSITDGSDIVTIILNGESATKKKIKIDTGDLPFTLTGLSITSLSLTNAGGGGSESLALLSFH
jgi:hypothetical protein